MKTYLDKRIQHLKEIKLDKKREKRYTAQLIRQGWSNVDLWGLNTHLANYMLPMLKKFFNNPMGYPCTLKSVKEWKDIGEKIIWALERFSKDDFFELANEKIGYKFDGNEEKRLAWIKEYERVYSEAQKGMHLFAEYFANLWD